MGRRQARQGKFGRKTGWKGTCRQAERRMCDGGHGMGKAVELLGPGLAGERWNEMERDSRIARQALVDLRRWDEQAGVR